MKKFFALLITILLVLVLSSCAGKQKLYLLNWDEYIDQALLDKFEQENNCTVIMEVAESCEIMYSRIKSEAADYDICIPSDYMIQQMKEEGMLQKINFDSLENYSSDMLDPTLQSKINELSTNLGERSYEDYFVPYFWGTLGIMYNTDLLSEEEFQERINALALEGKNEWNILFDKSLESEIGMYATSRDSIACALMALGYSVNTPVYKTDNNGDFIVENGSYVYTDEFVQAENLLKSMDYKAWATDDLKVGVAGGKYMLTLDYSGSYIDALYSVEDPTESGFNMYTPKQLNNLFFDAMVIPTTAQNVSLAHKFIDFMINTEVSEEDEESGFESSNSRMNADAIGYCPTIKAINDEIIDEVSEEGYEDEGYLYVVTTDAYDPSDVVGGEIYEYLGRESFVAYEEAYKRIKSGTDEEETNTSGIILICIMSVVVLGFAGVFVYINRKNKKTI